MEFKLNLTPKNKTFIVIFLFLISVFIITWPLITNLDGFLLPQQYKNISHSDSIQHISKIKEAKQLINNNKIPIIADETDVSQTYIFPGLFFTSVLGVKDVVFHNLFFLFCLFLAGFFMYLFMFELSKDRLASFLAGFIYLASYYVPYAYYWGHSNTLQIQWIPLIFLFLEKTLKHQKIKYAVYLGIAFSLQILSGTYYTVHLSFIMPFYIVLRMFFVNKKLMFKKITWINFSIAVLVALFASSFYLIKKLNSVVIIRTLSENMMDYWRLDSIKEILHIDYHLYLGTIQFLLVMFGIYIIWINIKNKDYRRYMPFIFMLLFILVSMLGPFSKIAPYYLLFKLWPYFDHLRVPFRLYPLFLLSASILSSILILYLKRYKGIDKHRVMIVCIIVAAILIAQILISPWLSNLHIFYP